MLLLGVQSAKRCSVVGTVTGLRAVRPEDRIPAGAIDGQTQPPIQHLLEFFIGV